MNVKIESIVKGISELTLLETNDLKDRLIKELGITMPTVMNVPSQVDTAVQEDVKTEFDVVLTGYQDGRKITVIKEIRIHTGLGIIEAKAAVENLPYVIKDSIDEKSANELKARFIDIGAIIEVK